MFRGVCEHLPTEQANEFRKFLIIRKDAIADPNIPIQRMKFAEHRIELNDEPLRRVPIIKREILDAEIKIFIYQGLIGELPSPWSFALV